MRIRENIKGLRQTGRLMSANVIIRKTEVKNKVWNVKSSGCLRYTRRKKCPKAVWDANIGVPSGVKLFSPGMELHLHDKSFH